MIPGRPFLLSLALSLTLAPAALLAQDAAPDLRSGDRAWLASGIEELKTHDSFEERQELARSLATECEKRLHEDSTALREAIGGGTLKVDVLVVGAGVHSSCFNANFSLVPNTLKVVTVEATNKVGGIFAQAGPAFRMNTSENTLPGAPLQPQDLQMIDQSKDGWTWTSSEIMGEIALFAHFSSQSDFLLGSGVRTVQVQPDGTSYLATLENDVRIEASTVVMSTGIGFQSLKGPLGAKVKGLIEKCPPVNEDAAEVCAIQYYDRALGRVNGMLEKGLLPHDAYLGGKTAVVGAGDSSKTFMEFLIGKAPPRIYGGQKIRVMPEAMWVGSDLQSSISYSFRYADNLSELVEPGMPGISLHEGRLSDVDFVNGTGPEGGIQIQFTSDQGTETAVVDRLVLATGPDNRVLQLIEGFNPETVEKQSINEWNAIHISVDGSQGIYLFGGAATNGVAAISHYAPRSSRFGKDLAEKLAQPN